MDPKFENINLQALVKVMLERTQSELKWHIFRKVWLRWIITGTLSVLFTIAAAAGLVTTANTGWILLLCIALVFVFGHIMEPFVEHAKWDSKRADCVRAPYTNIDVLEQLGFFLPEEDLQALRAHAEWQMDGLRRYHVIDVLKARLDSYEEPQPAPQPPTAPPELTMKQKQLAALTKKHGEKPNV